LQGSPTPQIFMNDSGWIFGAPAYLMAGGTNLLGIG